MHLPSARSVLRLGIGLLAPIALAVTLAGAATAAALDPTQVQVQYLPRDGAAIVFWNSVDKATGYNVYRQDVTQSGTTITAAAPVKVNTDPIVKVTSFMVDNLKNGTPYHFTVTAIVDGKESDPAGPTPHGDQGALVSVVPQQPVKLSGIDGFYGVTTGTDLPGSHQIDDKTGTITLKGSGWDVNGDADGMYFLAAPVKGDITVTVRVVSGPTETSSGTDWNLAGPQIRENLDAGSRLAMTQAARVGRAQFKFRDTYGTGTNEEDEDDSVKGHEGARRPIWLRLVRHGDDFSGFLSEDGKTFTKLDQNGTGGVHTLDKFPAEAYVGLAVASHDDGEYSTVVFDNFTITSP